MITIGKPKVVDMGNGYTRLVCPVDYRGQFEEIWYEVENQFAKYFCFERADAFVVNFLPFAMAFGHDIRVEAPISQRLYYQLKHYFIPSLGKFSHYYKQINLTADKLDNADYVDRSVNGVGTGFSAGVDSFYTALKHLNCEEPDYRLTHLAFFKVGATGSFGGEAADASFAHRTSLFRGFAERNGLPFVTVDSNVSEHAKMSFKLVHSYRTIAVVLALQKLFGKYYYSSGAPIGHMSFNPEYSSNYDFFSLNNFAVEGTAFYSTGLDCERFEKQSYVSQFPETYAVLNVCNDTAENCSRCEKCYRTMTGFYYLGILDRYRAVFDVDWYLKHKNKCIGLLLGKRAEGTAVSHVEKSLIHDIRKSGNRIPLAAYLYSIPYSLWFFGVRCARGNKIIRKWYHKKMHRELGCNYAD